MRKVIITFVTALLASITFTLPAVAAVPKAPQHPPAAPVSRDLAAYRWALTQAGKWYQWGATGPSTYDCSGLVYRAYLREGLTVMPRTTYEMLASSHLVRVAHPVPGDLAFYGTGHVEFYAGGNRTFGAHSTGEQISYRTWSASWHPTVFYRVR